MIQQPIITATSVFMYNFSHRGNHLSVLYGKIAIFYALKYQIYN